MKPLTACLAAAAVLAACSQGGGEEAGSAAAGAETAGSTPPTILLGTWAADCERPEIRLAADSIHVFAEDSTYPLTEAESGEGRLVLRYQGANGPVEETYAVEGETLALVEGVYDIGLVSWNRPPMQRCDPA